MSRPEVYACLIALAIGLLAVARRVIRIERLLEAKPDVIPFPQPLRVMEDE